MLTEQPSPEAKPPTPRAPRDSRKQLKELTKTKKKGFLKAPPTDPPHTPATEGSITPDPEQTEDRRE